jgi:NAD+ diphosphatase
VTLPHLRLAANAHDRLGVRRHDLAWLEQQWADERSRVLVIDHARVRPVDGVVPWLRPGELADFLDGRLVPGLAAPELDARRMLLGERDGRTWFGFISDGLSNEPASALVAEGWLSLREVLLGTAADLSRDAPLVFHGVGLAEWRRSTRFCPRCAGRLQPRAAGHELVCADCGRVQFPRTDPAVIMAITFGEPGSPEEQFLLGRQAVWPPGRFSTLAGFVEPGESLEDAVRREVFEEVGVVVGEVEYFGNQAWPFPSSLMLGLTGRAQSSELSIDRHEIEEARWFTRSELLEASQAGSVLIPQGVSISSSLVQHWFGGSLPGTW